MKIDESSVTPIFMQIAAWVKEEIQKGNFKEEEQIPSTNQFASAYKINPATVGKGFNLLVEEGILYKKRGIGMFVKAGACQTLKDVARQTFMKEKLNQFLREADNLGISREELIVLIKEQEGK